MRLWAIAALLLVVWPASAHGAGPRGPKIPVAMRCLKTAYPRHLCKLRANAIVWCDGTVMRWHDGKAKTNHNALLNTADLEDQMAQRYTPGRLYQVPPPVNFEPGRVRHEAFFRKMYGDSIKQVRKRVTTIAWMPRTVGKRLKVSTVNGVHEKLRAVGKELDKLPEKLRKIASRTSGTFVWRVIAGTPRLSMHSFAIAIDIGVPNSDYWKWRKRGPDGKLRYRNRIPMEIVEVFERHGFIWGGKWYHFDTMHFEYRPELLQPGCVGKPPRKLFSPVRRRD